MVDRKVVKFSRGIRVKDVAPHVYALTKCLKPLEIVCTSPAGFKNVVSESVISHITVYRGADFPYFPVIRLFASLSIRYKKVLLNPKIRNVTNGRFRFKASSPSAQAVHAGDGTEATVC